MKLDKNNSLSSLLNEKELKELRYIRKINREIEWLFYGLLIMFLILFILFDLGKLTIGWLLSAIWTLFAFSGWINNRIIIKINHRISDLEERMEKRLRGY